MDTKEVQIFNDILLLLLKSKKIVIQLFITMIKLNICLKMNY